MTVGAELQARHRSVVRRRVQGVLLHARADGALPGHGRHHATARHQEAAQLQELRLVHEERRLRRRRQVPQTAAQRPLGRGEILFVFYFGSREKRQKPQQHTTLDPSSRLP